MDPQSEWRAPTDETFSRTMRGLGRLVEGLTPWLLDLGSWVMGALIAFNLLILAALLTVGPVDRAVLVSGAALAVALPAGVAAFALLRLVRDLKEVRFAELAESSLEAVGFTHLAGAASAGAAELAQRRRLVAALPFAYGLLTLSALLTTTGATAAFWHLAWWIGAAFLASALASPPLLWLATRDWRRRLAAGGQATAVSAPPATD